MKSLIREVRALQKSNVRNVVEKRLKEFEKVGKRNAWFSELCFCLLTANSKAETALQIQKELGLEGFIKKSFSEVRDCIIRNKHRFHNNKAKFIVEARKYLNIKDVIEKNGEVDGRKWLVTNVKGLGYKEASHFLRNVGYKNLAILDRHIINLMVGNSLIEKPKVLNKKNYLDIEKEFKKVAGKVGMSLAELDLYMWYMKTGKVLK